MMKLNQALLSSLAIAYLMVIGTYPARADNKAEAEIAAELAEGDKLSHNDSDMTCEQIAHEVVELDRIIRTARETQQSSNNAGTGVTVAKTVGSILVGSLGGVVGIAAVGALAGEAAEDSGEKAAVIEENAEERQNRLAGVFDGKGCEGELALTGEEENEPEDPSKVEPSSGTALYKPKKPNYNE